MTQKSCQHSNLKLQWRKNSQDDVGKARQRLELLRENDSVTCSKEIHTTKVPQVHVYTSLCTRKGSKTCTHTHTCTHAHTHTHTDTHTDTHRHTHRHTHTHTLEQGTSMCWLLYCSGSPISVLKALQQCCKPVMARYS